MQAKIFVEKSRRGCPNAAMTTFDEEKPVSIRMPASLETEISGIAREEQRSRNTTILLLLRKGIESYRVDFSLLNKSATAPSPAASNTANASEGREMITVERGETDKAPKRSKRLHSNNK